MNYILASTNEPRPIELEYNYREVPTSEYPVRVGPWYVQVVQPILWELYDVTRDPWQVGCSDVPPYQECLIRNMRRAIG